MEKRAVIFVILVIVAVLSLSSYSKEADNANDKIKATEIPISKELKKYNNLIDEYFLSKIEIAEPESYRRSLQDTYKNVWKEEFENIIEWMLKKCLYEKDKEIIQEFAKSVQKNIEITKQVFVMELLDTYKVSLEPEKAEDITRISLWGTGTQSRLNQIEGELYRDASMHIIQISKTPYTFLQRDYSSLSYE